MLLDAALRAADQIDRAQLDEGSRDGSVAEGVLVADLVASGPWRVAVVGVNDDVVRPGRAAEPDPGAHDGQHVLSCHALDRSLRNGDGLAGVALRAVHVPADAGHAALAGVLPDQPVAAVAELAGPLSDPPGERQLRSVQAALDPAGRSVDSCRDSVRLEALADDPQEARSVGLAELIRAALAAAFGVLAVQEDRQHELHALGFPDDEVRLLDCFRVRDGCREEIEGEGDAESLAGGSVFLVLRVVNDPAVAIATVAQPDDGGLDVARDRLPVDRPLKSGDVNDRFH